MMTPIQVKLLNENAVMPTKAHPTDAGYDLYACFDGRDTIYIPPHATAIIGTGIAIEMPDYIDTNRYSNTSVQLGVVGKIYARSGLASKKGLAPANKVGVIDSSYRGEIKVALHNHGNVRQSITNGERIAQLVFEPYLLTQLTEVDELSETERGEGGFGSTGE